jgi:uncharacterized protein
VNIRALHSADALRAAAWDSLLGPGDLYLSTDWLQTVEKWFPVPPSYLLAADDAGAPVAGVAAYVQGETAPPSSFYRTDQVLLRLLGTRTAPVDDELRELLPTVLCGGRQSCHSRLLVDHSLPDDDRRRVTRRMLDELDGAADRIGASSLAFLYVDEDDVTLRSSLRDAGYAEFASGICSILEIRSSTFEEYLAGFKAGRRRVIREDLAKLESAGVELAVEPLTESLVPELAPLEAAVHRKYGDPRELSASRRMLTSLARDFGDRTTMSIARMGGRICGFAGLIRWRDEIHLRHVGFDYGLQGSVPVYFGAVFYEPVRFAQRSGAARIDYSIESADAKRRRGCRQILEYGYVRCLDESVHARVAQLLHGVVEPVPA